MQEIFREKLMLELRAHKKNREVTTGQKKNLKPVRDIKKRNHEFSNSQIHKMKVLHKCQRAFSNPCLIVYYFLFIALKNILSLTFSFYRL